MNKELPNNSWYEEDLNLYVTVEEEDIPDEPVVIQSDGSIYIPGLERYATDLEKAVIVINNYYKDYYGNNKT